jgi:hypothetical protein
VRLNTRGSDVRLARVRGETNLQLQAGELRGVELAGPIEIEATTADVVLEGFQRANGPLRVNSVGGSVTIRGLRSEGRIDARDAEIDVAIDRAAPLAIFNSGETVRVTLPPDAFTLDAATTDGQIMLPDAIKSQIAVSGSPDGKDHKASGSLHGGGPTITVRATRSEIRFNARD